jgi:hypothetical protein
MVCEFCVIVCMVTKFVVVKFWSLSHGGASFLMENLCYSLHGYKICCCQILELITWRCKFFNGKYMQNINLKIGIHKYKKVENYRLQ